MFCDHAAAVNQQRCHIYLLFKPEVGKEAESAEDAGKTLENKDGSI